MTDILDRLHPYRALLWLLAFVGLAFSVPIFLLMHLRKRGTYAAQE